MTSTPEAKPPFDSVLPQLQGIVASRRNAYRFAYAFSGNAEVGRFCHIRAHDNFRAH